MRQVKDIGGQELSPDSRQSEPTKLGLHPLVQVLEDGRPGRSDQCGLFNILSGECVRLSKAFLKETMSGSKTSAAEAAREALFELDLLSLGPGDSADDLLFKWRDRKLSIPAHVPTLVSVCNGAPRLYRTEGLETCQLPRVASLPSVVREELDPRCIPLFEAAEANAPIGETLERMRLDSNEAMALLTWLAHPARQSIRLLASEAAELDLRSQHHYPMQSFSVTSDIAPARVHYESDLADPQLNFDWMETTVAHAFRGHTAALAGRSYGEALFWKLTAQARNPSRLRILEVGAGTGDVALGFLKAALHCGVAVEYHIIDRSSSLLSAQAKLFQANDIAVNMHCGDAQCALPAVGAFDVILANEVISDFDVVDGIQRGAREFVKLLRNSLSPGGSAFLIEYGGLGVAPERVEHLAHEEYSIDFADLRDVARACGLEVNVSALGDWLGVHWNTPMLVGQHERMLCLSAVFADYGTEIPWQAFDRDSFNSRYGNLCARIGLKRLTYAPLRSGHHFGPDFRQFLVLEASRVLGAPEKGVAK